MVEKELKYKTSKDLSLHPCFNEKVKGKYGRVHLPVAPKCNVQCNYCNRKYDCVNESRPGVSSTLLSPSQSVMYMDNITRQGTPITVVGIAGPGDPFANPDETFGTIKAVQEKFPDMLFCLSSNGIDVPQYVDKIAEANVSHVTITMNGIDPQIVSQIYSWVRYKKRVYRGLEAAKLVIERQTEAIKLLKKRNIVVKVNTIILPGINDKHIIEVAKYVSELGADLMNCIPVHPNEETAFADIEEPSKEMVHLIQKEISEYIKPMKHCSRCRADAAGLLGHDMRISIPLLQEISRKPLFATENRPNVAVASLEGMLVNQHLGETRQFAIYSKINDNYEQIEMREAPPAGLGDERWTKLAKILNDCSTILVSGAGKNPQSILESMGIKVIQMNGLIEAGLDGVFKGAPLIGLVNPQKFKCGEGCSGGGGGCG